MICAAILLAAWTAELDAYSLQVHSLAFAGEWAPGGLLRVGLEANGDYYLSGLRSLQSFLGSGALEATVALDESAHTSTLVAGRAQLNDATATGFDHLDGYRLEARAGQRWRWKAFRANLVYRNRREMAGTRLVNVDGVLPRFVREYRVPHAHRSHALSSRLDLGVGRLKLSVDSILERLQYSEDHVLRGTGRATGTEFARVRRRDLRFVVAPEIAFDFGRNIEAGLRYEQVAMVHGRAQVDVRRHIRAQSLANDRHPGPIPFVQPPVAVAPPRREQPCLHVELAGRMSRSLLRHDDGFFDKEHCDSKKRCSPGKTRAGGGCGPQVVEHRSRAPGPCPGFGKRDTRRAPP
jgi:hypothetical protein